MTAKELIIELLTMEMDADLFLDAGGGLKGSLKITGVRYGNRYETFIQADDLGVEHMDLGELGLCRDEED